MKNTRNQVKSKNHKLLFESILTISTTISYFRQSYQTTQNAEKNSVLEKISVCQSASAIPTADVLLANILLNPLIELAPGFAVAFIGPWLWELSWFAYPVFAYVLRRLGIAEALQKTGGARD